MKPFPTLETNRLILRAFTLDDAPNVKRLAGVKEIAANTLPIPYPYEDGVAEQWISTHSEKYEREQEIIFAIVLKQDGVLIGAIGLTDIHRDHQKAAMGYWIGIPYWSQGFCTEAGKAVIAYAFESLKLNRIQAEHFARNPASGSVMRKIGMSYEGTLRQNVKKWGTYEDCLVYSILKSDMKIVKNG